MTTVGYGDISPHTNLGRGIATTVMAVGIGFVAIVTAALAERFMAHQVREEALEVQEEVISEIETTNADVRAELRAIAQRLAELERRL